MTINQITGLTGSTQVSANTMSAANPGGAFWSGFGAVVEGTDALASTATAYTLRVGQSFHGSINNSSDSDYVRINLVAGQTYDFRLLGYGENFNSDPRLYLRDAAGNYLTDDDDGFTSFSSTHETDSALTFTATYTGTYFLEADSFNTSTGGYLLSATVDVAGGPILTVDEMAWQLINNGEAFFGSPEAAAFNVGVDNTLTVNISGLTAQGQFLAQQALRAWTNVTGINFQVTAGVAEITFDDSQTGAFANPITSGGTITSATVNIGLDWLTSFGTSLASYSFETYIHEIGHALGLGHGGNYNGSASYGTDNYYINDSVAWSIMSYMNAYNDEFDFGNPGDVNTYVAADFRYIFTPQIVDIIAIQELYGTFNGAFNGNTTYGFGGNTGVAAIDQAVNSGALMAMTVYDTGGIDTLNFSGTSVAQTITLSAESLSSVLGGVHNFGIARGVVIENAIGGTGVDRIFGNSANNVLNGGADAVVDILSGGLGNDTYILGAGSDTVSDTGGIDTIQSSIARNLTSYATIENLSMIGTANINGTGNALVNRITGNAGNNVLNGGIDALVDTLIGGAGNDIYVLAAGNDLVNDASGIDAIHTTITRNLSSYSTIENLVLTGTASINGIGNVLANRIVGNAGNNALNGALGNDILTGGAGLDSFAFSTALSASNIDTITDYNVANDTIRLDNAVFTTLALGNLAAGAFASNTTGLAGDASDRIIYESDTGRLFYDANGLGGAAGIHFATLTAGLALTQADFVVF